LLTSDCYISAASLLLPAAFNKTTAYKKTGDKGEGFRRRWRGGNGKGNFREEEKGGRGLGER
jgi:hypothetical protein